MGKAQDPQKTQGVAFKNMFITWVGPMANVGSLWEQLELSTSF